MRAAAIAIVLAASPAAAGPFTVGTALGVTQSRTDASSSPNPTLGVFGRLEVAHRFALQLSIARVDLPAGDMLPGVDMKQVDLAVIHELGDGALVPIVLADVGLDRAQWQSIRDTIYTHAEIGIGIEWRIASGLSLGADVRLGDRSIFAQSKADIETYLEPRMLSEGQYYSSRVALGVRF